METKPTNVVLSHIYFLYVNIRILGFRTHLGITFSAFMTHLGITIICFSITYWDEITQLFSLLLSRVALEIAKVTGILNAENKDFYLPVFRPYSSPIFSTLATSLDPVILVFIVLSSFIWQHVENNAPCFYQQVEVSVTISMILVTLIIIL